MHFPHRVDSKKERPSETTLDPYRGRCYHLKTSIMLFQPQEQTVLVFLPDTFPIIRERPFTPYLQGGREDARFLSIEGGADRE